MEENGREEVAKTPTLNERLNQFLLKYRRYKSESDIDLILLNELTVQDLVLFSSEFEAGRKSLLAARMFSVFLGGVGAHRFYLGKGTGLLYMLVCWNPLPWVIGVCEAFFMGKRVEKYNAELVQGIVAKIKALRRDDQGELLTHTLFLQAPIESDSAKDEAVVEIGSTGLLLEEGSSTAESAPPPPPAPVAASEARGDAAESSVSSQAAEKLRQQTIQAEEIRAVARDTLVGESTRGKIEIVGEKIRITHKGFVAFTEGTTGTKEILISQISSIQFRPAGKLLLGYIQFTFPGSQDTKGLTASAGDENALTFTDEEQPAFEVLKEKIDEIRNDFAQARAGAAPVSQMDELEKLAALRDRGIVSEEEFQAKKKQILGI